MSTFASEMRAFTQCSMGKNGALEMKTSGNSILDSFVNILKDTESKTVHDKVRQMLNDVCYLSSDSEKAEAIHDIFILAFHKRSTSKYINGEQLSDGEGLKNIYYEYILELYNFYPQTIISLVAKRDMFMFGYWKDIYLIWEKINLMDLPIEQKYAKYNPLITTFRNTIINQRGEDLDCVYNAFGIDTIKNMNEEQFNSFLNTKSDTHLKISYIGKYCVRENSSFDKKCFWYIKHEGDYVKCGLVDFIIRYTLKSRVNGRIQAFPIHKTIPFGAKKIWRKDNVKLNTILNVPENKFCSNKWSEINFKNVPSMCFKLKTKALLNEKLNPGTMSNQFDDTGDRFPTSKDRIDCRHNLIDYISHSAKINCSQLFPHQISGNIFKHISLNQKLVNLKLWESLVNYTKERIYSSTQSPLSGCCAGGNILCCADTSGSMEQRIDKDRPIDIAVSLTAFISEIANDNFKDLAMSFTDIPTIMELRKNDGSMDLYERIKTITSRVGYSTNYLGLHTCLLDLCKLKNIEHENIPTLIIFSDGHFDAQIEANPQNTHDQVVKMWLEAGYKGPPQIVYWNLASNKDSVQVHKSFPNVQLLSGCGVSNIKYVLYGEQLDETTEEVVIDGTVVTVTGKSITPEKTMRKALDEPYFDCIRNVLKTSHEGYLTLFN